MEPRGGQLVQPSRREQARTLVAIALGGALGTPARYEIAQLIHVPKDTFPWATFWTNLTGAFVLGLFATIVDERFRHTRYPRPFFAIGFLGAYTTFSTMSVETVLLVKDGHGVLGVGYLVASIVAGLALGLAGIRLGRALAARTTVRRSC